MSLVNITADFSKVIPLLERIAIALENLMLTFNPSLGQPVTDPPPVRQAQLSDLIVQDPARSAEVEQGLADFASFSQTKLHSPAFKSAIIDYERQRMNEYGADSVFRLPWNRAAGRWLFERDHREEIQKQLLAERLELLKRGDEQLANAQTTEANRAENSIHEIRRGKPESSRAPRPTSQDAS